MSHASRLVWERHDTGLCLRVDDRHIPVPPMVTALLVGDADGRLTDDPALDLLVLDLDLRRYARQLAAPVTDAAGYVARGRDAVIRAGTEPGLAGRRHRRRALEFVGIASTLHTSWAARLRHVRSWIEQVRQFVVDAGAPVGPLAEAAAGWHRGPDGPTFVREFPDMAAFLSEDPRRAEAAGWAYRSTAAGGVEFGRVWRRNGDDEDTQAAPVPRTGPWRLAYLPRTGEVYASRRAGRRPERVWLIGHGWTADADVMGLLTMLTAHMHEPNSVILAAHAVNRATTGPPPATGSPEGERRRHAPPARRGTHPGDCGASHRGRRQPRTARAYRARGRLLCQCRRQCRPGHATSSEVRRRRRWPVIVADR